MLEGTEVIRLQSALVTRQHHVTERRREDSPRSDDTLRSVVTVVIKHASDDAVDLILQYNHVMMCRTVNA